MRLRASLFFAALCAQGCAFAQSGSVPPHAEDPSELEARTANDISELDAVAALAALHLAEGRIDEARNLLSRADEAVPGDPSIPLLLAVADERSGEVRRARERYELYGNTHYGILAARARERLVATSLEVLRMDVRDLHRAPFEELPPVDSTTLAVVPFARPIEEGTMDATSAAVAALAGSSLSAQGWDVVDATRVRALLEEMDLSGTARADVAVGVELGRRFSAARVVQGVARRVALDSVEWNVTVTHIASPARLQVDVISLSGAMDEAPLMLQSLAAMIGRPPDRPRIAPGQAESVATLSHEALVAFGSGLVSRDRGDWETARGAFQEASGLDSQFGEAISLAAEAEAFSSLLPLDSLVQEVARVGGLQRAVQALRETGSRAGGATGLSRGSGRPMLSDMLGLDALGGGVLIDVTLTVPGGGP